MEPAAPSGGTPTILLVEPDVLVRHALAEYLRGCGFRAIEVSSIDEARRLLDADAFPVDVVLIDVDASGEGFALARLLRAEHPGVKVILAGSAGKAAETAGDLCGDLPTAPKPYNHHGLLDTIRRLLAARDRDRL